MKLSRTIPSTIVTLALFALFFLPSLASAQKAYTIKSGNNYLAHRYNGVSYEIYTTTHFSDECVWYTVNNNNYYFTDPGGTQHYIYASFGLGYDGAGAAADANNPSLGAGAALELREAVGNITTSSGGYYFYNWDWGLAHGQQYFNLGGSCPSEFNSEGDECWRCYWLVYDDHDGDGVDTWHMSTTASYESIAHYATFEPVRIIDRPDRVTMQSGGLTALTPFTMTFSTASVAEHSLAGNATFVSPYTNKIAAGYMSYALGVLSNCRGDWTVRVCDTTWTYHNFFMTGSETQVSDHGTDTIAAVQHSFNPAADNITSYSWTLSSTDYLSFASGSAESTSSAVAPTVYYRVPCVEDGGATVTLTLTVTYSDNSKQTRVAVITVNRFLAPPATITCAGVTLTEGENGTVSPVFANPSYTLVDEGYELSFAGSGLTIDNATKHVITAVTPGQYNVTITSTAEGGVTGTVAVTVLPLAPTVSFTPSAATASVSISENSSCDGGAYQYSLDGETWNAFISLTVNSGVTVYGRYTCNGQTSAAASATFQATSGVYSTEKMVVLNDYEDHSWSYYSDPHCPIRSLNPVDVKITYYGNGTNNMTTTDVVDNPTTFAANATGVKVGPEDDYNTFVYYKTLERTNGEGAVSMDAANGPAKYTTIPNPFQVRPTGINNGTILVTPTTRTIRIETSRSEYAWSGFDEGSTLTVSWSGSTQSVISSRTTTTLVAPVGVTVTLTYTPNATSTNRENRSRVTVYYDESGNTTAVATYSPNSNLTNTFTVAAPASSSVSCDVYRGFYAWRVKSAPTGGSVYSDEAMTQSITTNSIINAETPIYFLPSSNDTKMGLELEALWAQAYVTTNSTSLSYYVSGITSAYERNFHVLTANGNASSYQQSYPHTVTSRYPNSSEAFTKRTLSGEFSAESDTKFEDVALSAENNNYNAQGYDLIVGRGVPTTNYCSNNLYGINANSGALDFTLRIESGKWNNIYVLGSSKTYSGVVSTRIVFGCDYDRANNNNNNNMILLSKNNTQSNGEYTNGQIYGGEQLTFSGSGNRNNLTFDYTVKSGTLQSNRLGSARGDEGVYLGSSQAGGGGNLQYIGKRRITIEGGNMASIAAGMNNVSTTYGVNDGKWAVMVRMKGGTVRGSIYGAAAFAQAVGDRYMIFTGGTVNGWVAGGCNGYKTGSGGTLNGDTKLYVGGNTHIEHSNADPQIATSYGGNVFGAGSGYSASYDIGEVNNSTVVVSDNSVVSRNVYGGGNYGYVADGGTTNMYIAGNATVKGGVFGGANQRTGETVNIMMVGGNVQAGVFGGSNTDGTVDGPVTINIYGGTVGVSESSTANVHGGGFGNTTVVTGDVEITIGHADSSASQPTIYGDVYGGSAMGTVNGTAYTAGRHTYVTVNQGLITGNGTTNTAKIKGDGSTNAQTFTATGSVYGGGLGTTTPNSYAANVYGGTVRVLVNGGTMNNTFGCNNANGLPYGAVSTTIHGGTIGNVYGGGNAAAYGSLTNNSIPYVTMDGGTVLHDVYGGGLGSGAALGDNTTNRNTSVIIEGTARVLENVFGGGSAAQVNGSTFVKVRGHAKVGNNVYGGGNAAVVTGNTNVEIGNN